MHFKYWFKLAEDLKIFISRERSEEPEAQKAHFWVNEDFFGSFYICTTGQIRQNWTNRYIWCIF